MEEKINNTNQLYSNKMKRIQIKKNCYFVLVRINLPSTLIKTTGVKKLYVKFVQISVTFVLNIGKI